jgi:hypothetical protein
MVTGTTRVAETRAGDAVAKVSAVVLLLPKAPMPWHVAFVTVALTEALPCAGTENVGVEGVRETIEDGDVGVTVDAATAAVERLKVVLCGV